MKTFYLWVCVQSEPGMSGKAYKITIKEEKPAALDVVVAHNGLAYQESFYGDWELMGTVLAVEHLVDDCGNDYLRGVTGSPDDDFDFSPRDIAECNFYKKIQTGSRK